MKHKHSYDRFRSCTFWKPSFISGKDANLNRQCEIETRCVCTTRVSAYELLEQKMPQEDQHLRRVIYTKVKVTIQPVILYGLGL